MTSKRTLLLLGVLTAVLLAVAGGTALGTDAPEGSAAEIPEAMKPPARNSAMNPAAIGPAETDTTPPTIRATPIELEGISFCTGGTPVKVGLYAQDPESAISAVSAEINGREVPLSSVTGLGTGSVQAKGSFTADAMGAYVLKGHAASLGGTGEVTNNFSINYLVWPTRLVAEKDDSGESTVPVRFSVRDCKQDSIHDESVQVVVTEITSAGEEEVLNGRFGEGPSAIGLDKVGNYLINFHPAPGEHKYRVDVYLNDYNGKPFKQSSRTRTVSVP